MFTTVYDTYDNNVNSNFEQPVTASATIVTITLSTVTPTSNKMTPKATATLLPSIVIATPMRVQPLSDSGSDNDIEQQANNELNQPIVETTRSLHHQQQPFLTGRQEEFSNLTFVSYIISIGFIVCDLCFMLIDKSCVNTNIRGINMTLNDYLLVNVILVIINVVITTLALIDAKSINIKQSISHTYIPFKFIHQLTAGMSYLLWFIGIVLWFGTLYNKGHCDSDIKSYITAKIIIQIIILFLYAQVDADQTFNLFSGLYITL